MHEKRPRHYAEDLVFVMRDWLIANVPAKERKTVLLHIRTKLLHDLPAGEIDLDD